MKILVSTLVVLDFSGTLSLETVLFGRAENLINALHASGLWGLGVQGLDVFWHEIIERTWEQGATTAIGYQCLLHQHLSRFCAASHERIAASVAAFAEAYFESCAIEPAWAPVLRKLVAAPATVTLVATDHYAEATGQIVMELQALGLVAQSVRRTMQPVEPGQILVANSADLGALKAMPEFWQRVLAAHRLPTITRILVIDDFGGNETSQDRYALTEKCVARQRAMMTVLVGAFGCPVAVFPFILQDKPASIPKITTEFHTLIQKTESFLMENLIS
jgi:hypothetical protein